MIGIIQHIGIETAGLIESLFIRKGIEYGVRKPYLGEELWHSDMIDGLVVMGGPMGVYEAKGYSYLYEEMKLIEELFKLNKPVLGICLGSQLMAEVLGGKVYRSGQQEIGWKKIQSHLTKLFNAENIFPNSFYSLMWHGDLFKTPKEAKCVLSTEFTACASFLWNEQSLGLVCHLESTQVMIQNMVEFFKDECALAGVNGGDIVSNMSQYLPSMHQIGNKLFGAWIEQLNTRGE